MKLTPTKIRFLAAAAAPGARVLKVSPLSRAAYYLVGDLKLQEKLGDNLRSLGLIERDDNDRGTLGKRPYKITELGRNHSAKADGRSGEPTMKFHDEMMVKDPVYAAAYTLQLKAEAERDWETAAIAVRVMNARNPFTFADAVASWSAKPRAT